MTKLFLHP